MIKKENKIIGKVKCPECKHEQNMNIPKNKCIPFYNCNNCKSIIVAKRSCCVFCDYGNKKCPSSILHKKR